MFGGMVYGIVLIVYFLAVSLIPLFLIAYVICSAIQAKEDLAEIARLKYAIKTFLNNGRLYFSITTVLAMAVIILLRVNTAGDIPGGSYAPGEPLTASETELLDKLSKKRKEFLEQRIVEWDDLPSE